MTSQDLAKAWNEAHVANLMSVTDPETGSNFGAFTITHDLLQIFSLNPEADYEVNPHTITDWRMLFMPDNHTLVYADYQEVLKTLSPFILAQENDSILVRKLSQTELEEIFRLAHGKTLQN